MFPPDRPSLRRVVAWTGLFALATVLSVGVVTCAGSQVNGYYYCLYTGEVLRLQDRGMIGVWTERVYPRAYPPPPGEPLPYWVGGSKQLKVERWFGTLSWRLEWEMEEFTNHIPLLVDDRGDLSITHAPLEMPGKRTFVSSGDYDLPVVWGNIDSDQALAFVRLDSREVAELMRRARREQPSRDLADDIDAVRRRHPDDPLLAMLELDLWVLLSDADEAQRVLDESLAVLEVDSRLLVRRSVDHYRAMIAAIRAWRAPMSMPVLVTQLGGLPPLERLSDVLPPLTPALLPRPYGAVEGTFLFTYQAAAQGAQARAIVLAVCGETRAAIDCLRDMWNLALAAARDMPPFVIDMITIRVRARVLDTLELILLNCDVLPQDLEYANAVLDTMQQDADSAPPDFFSMRTGWCGTGPPVEPGIREFIIGPAWDQVVTARMVVLREAVRIRHRYLLDGEFPASIEDRDAMADGIRTPIDPFTRAALLYDSGQADGTEARVWSMGLDRTDERGLTVFSWDNGIRSSGDIVVVVPRSPKFPGSRQPPDANSRGAFLASFPTGLPPEVLGTGSIDRSVLLLDTHPVTLLARSTPNWKTYSGEDDERALYRPVASLDNLTTGSSVCWIEERGWCEGPATKPGLPYDPMGGLRSEGDVWFQPPATVHSGEDH